MCTEAYSAESHRKKEDRYQVLYLLVGMIKLNKRHKEKKKLVLGIGVRGTS
jgi:hypothetical protein